MGSVRVLLITGRPLRCLLEPREKQISCCLFALLPRENPPLRLAAYSL